MGPRAGGPLPSCEFEEELRSPVGPGWVQTSESVAPFLPQCSQSGVICSERPYELRCKNQGAGSDVPLATAGALSGMGVRREPGQQREVYVSGTGRLPKRVREHLS